MSRAISPTVHPDVTTVPEARRGLEVARSILEGLAEVEEAVAVDRALTPAARVARIREYCSRGRPVGTNALDSTLGTLRTLLQTEEARIGHTIGPRGHDPQAVKRREELNRAIGHVGRASTAFVREMASAEERVRKAAEATARWRFRR